MDCQLESHHQSGHFERISSRLYTPELRGCSAAESGSSFDRRFPDQSARHGGRWASCDRTVFYSSWDTPLVNSRPSIADPRGSSKHFWFNTSAFSHAPLGSFGNAGRGIIHGPGLNNTDFVLAKDTHITESKYFEMRIEFYDIFNHAQFSDPVMDINSSSFGRIFSTQVPGRIIQLGGKFYF